MKSIVSALMIAVLGLASASAMACPKGEHTVGGTGAHHKGGSCTKMDGSSSGSSTQHSAKHKKSKHSKATATPAAAAATPATK